MRPNCEGSLHKQEIQNKNNANFPRDNFPPTFPFEFTPKKIDGNFKFLRTERDPVKLNISEESQFFNNIGQSMENFLGETCEAQNELFPVLKNEFLFIKEIVESRVKFAKVA